MKAVIQRVSKGSVTVDGIIAGEIKEGVMVLLGVEKGDRDEDARYLADKIVALRIFSDDQGKMNLSVKDIGGSILSISQFTLAGNCSKGRRPSFDKAAPADEGKRLYDAFNSHISSLEVPIQTGIFQSDMKVELVNEGPVTFILESR